MLRVSTIASGQEPNDIIPFDIVVLTSDERHVRRKVLTLQHGDAVLVDLAETVMLAHGDRLVLDDGRHAEVIAGEEDLLEARARDGLHLIELAWHLGNRHLPAQIETDRILIGRDHVIRDMLIGLGADVRDVSEPFQPVRGAYHKTGGAGPGHTHHHGHGHNHGHSHSHSHAHHLGHSDDPRHTSSHGGERPPHPHRHD